MQTSSVGPCGTLVLMRSSRFVESPVPHEYIQGGGLPAWQLPPTQVLPQMAHQGQQHRWPDMQAEVQPQVRLQKP